MNNEFQVGDVVSLKSSPKVEMTITKSKNGYGKYACTWFDSEKQLRTGTFIPDILLKVNSETTGSKVTVATAGSRNISEDRRDRE